MRSLRRKPEHEAESVSIKANSIEKPKYFPRSKTDGANRTTVTGDISITMNKQHPGSRDKEVRPDRGTVLTAPGKDAKAIVEARLIDKHKGTKAGQETATASKRVEIFGKLQRSADPEKKAAPKRGRSQ